MKKLLVSIAVVLMILAFGIGCKSGPDIEGAPMTAPRFKIIEHQNSTLGGDVPFWATMDTGALEEDERFEGKYVFKFEQTGQDLSGVKTVANNMNATSEISRLVNVRVQEKFAGAEVGDQDATETYFERVVKTMSDATISGFRKYGDFWVLKQYYDDKGNPGRQEYAYYTLYTIDEQKVNDLIQAAIEENQATTDAEKTAKQRVKEVFGEGL
ncbi:MAG: hypothetical protein ACLFST_04725 [Spirochaetia bacterium]